jgi:hypothetical protein
MPSTVMGGEAPGQRASLREAENGIRQFDLALEMIRSFDQAALDGIHPLAGTWRNTKVSIGKSKHVPPEAAFVSEEIEHLCEYVRENWSRNAVHLGAYVLWKLNWIHPFADGNGRTARAVAYVVISAKLDSLLPGAPTIPEQIAANKAPYYSALEAADERLKDGAVDVSDLEKNVGRDARDAAFECSETGQGRNYKSQHPKLPLIFLMTTCSQRYARLMALASWILTPYARANRSVS